MDISQLAALVFALVAVGVIAFQVAMALGAPWGAYAMGGAFPGRFPPALRAAAVVQAALIGLLAAIVLSAADLVWPGLVDTVPCLAWLPVVVSAVASGLNAISRSAGERRIWVPVTLAMLVTSLIVALSAT
jgi:hypothetical protein